MAVAKGLEVRPAHDAVSDLTLTVLAAAEFERAVIVERTLDGLAAAKRRVKLGCLPKPRMPKYEKVAALRERGRSWAEIGKALRASPYVFLRDGAKKRLRFGSGDFSTRWAAGMRSLQERSFLTSVVQLPHAGFIGMLFTILSCGADSRIKMPDGASGALNGGLRLNSQIPDAAQALILPGEQRSSGKSVRVSVEGGRVGALEARLFVNYPRGDTNIYRVGYAQSIDPTGIRQIAFDSLVCSDFSLPASSDEHLLEVVVSDGGFDGSSEPKNRAPAAGALSVTAAWTFRCESTSAGSGGTSGGQAGAGG